MNHQEKIDRDVERDSKSALYYRGYTFPQYEGRLTRDEFNSGQTFYAFWFGTYHTERAIKHIVSAWLEQGKLPEAA